MSAQEAHDRLREASPPAWGLAIKRHCAAGARLDDLVCLALDRSATVRGAGAALALRADGEPGQSDIGVVLPRAEALTLLQELGAGPQRLEAGLVAVTVVAIDEGRGVSVVRSKLTMPLEVN